MSNSGGNLPSNLQAQKNHDSAIQVRGGDRYDDQYHSSYYYHESAGFWDKVLPIAGTFLKSCLVVTLGLYILNQKHLLPKPLSAVVSKALFWPTLPITVGRRLGSWSTVVDDTVIIGGAPFGFVKFPERLYYEYGVRGVINMCEEYQGPDSHYERLGMKHLRLPTVDHFEPTVQDYETAVAFIQKHRERGEKVYVHCRAGHGRSAAVVFAWLLFKDPTDADLYKLNRDFCQIRNVRKTLWKQKNIHEFFSRLRGRSDFEMTELSERPSESDGEDDNTKKDL